MENSYAKEDLKDALKAIASTISKIGKVRGKDTLHPSQRTLIERRLKALRISSELIAAKMDDLE